VLNCDDEDHPLKTNNYFTNPNKFTYYRYTHTAMIKQPQILNER